MNRTLGRVGLVLLIAAGAPHTLGSTHGDATVWQRAQLQTWDAKLLRELDKEGASSELLGKYANYHVEIAHRSASGNAELHETQNDVFFILSGEATLITGGTLVEPKTTDPHEIEAKSIHGGTRTDLTPGDVVHIPFKVPHQLILDRGKQISYFVVKINAL